MRSLWGPGAADEAKQNPKTRGQAPPRCSPLHNKEPPPQAASRLPAGARVLNRENSSWPRTPLPGAVPKIRVAAGGGPGPPQASR